MPLPEQTTRGVKRRRRDDKEGEEDKEAKLQRKLRHALRGLRRVVKKAKTFEIQKTLKKLKDARREDPESDLTKDLGAQMRILKHLNHDQLAHSALMTKLKKNKILSADPSIQTMLVELASNLAPPGMPGTLMAKVQSRILSSKVIASEVVLIVEHLRTFLHPFVGPQNTGDAMHYLQASLDISKRKMTVIGHEIDASSSKDKPTRQGRDGGYEDTGSDEAMAESNNGWESGTVGGLDDSMARSSDDQDDVTIDQCSADSDDPTEYSKKAWQSHGSKGQSEFLPCLSVGFTRGDSGSEFSDSETRLVDGIKKNRRGQRARRAIWEKKFGKNANHIKKRREQVGTSGRRVLPLDRPSGKGSSASRPKSISTRPSTNDHRPVNDPGRIRLWEKQDTSLHPSWEAKRKHKAAGIVPSQGTKIVFSES